MQAIVAPGVGNPQLAYSSVSQGLDYGLAYGRLTVARWPVACGTTAAPANYDSVFLYQGGVTFRAATINTQKVTQFNPTCSRLRL